MPSSGRLTSRLEASLIPNPILRVLSSMAEQRVRCLLMGDQACVFYGAAEFSRDSDFAILAEPENLRRRLVGEVINIVGKEASCFWPNASC